MPDRQITVFLADDNLIVREGVRALIGLEPDLTVVGGAAADYDGLVAGAEEAAPQVVVTDIRMPPTYQQEGIDAAKEVRKRHPGTGVVGDAVMAVFGAPIAQDDHARRAARAASAMHAGQEAVNERWRAQGLPEFGLGIGLSSGRVAAALLGSEERLEYSLVGDAVNLAQRLQQWAEAGQTVLSQPTAEALDGAAGLEALAPAHVKGRDATVHAYRLLEPVGA